MNKLFIGFVIVSLFGGCYMSPDNEVQSVGIACDSDRDGYADWDCNGDGEQDELDCDDGDKAVYPGADELCDGIDNDCDGYVDEGDVCDKPDYDGDGDPDQSDCAPEDPYKFHGAAENCTNDVDDDCDGKVDGDDNECQGSSSSSSSSGSSSSSSSGTPPATGKVKFVFTGTVNGQITFFGAWTTPNGKYDWPQSSACPDTNSSDNKLECDLDMPSGSTGLTFNVKQSNGSYWGDVSNDPLGGHGSTNGNAQFILPTSAEIGCSPSNAAGTNSCTLKSNGSGPDYRDGYVAAFSY